MLTINLYIYSSFWSPLYTTSGVENTLEKTKNLTFKFETWKIHPRHCLRDISDEISLEM